MEFGKLVDGIKTVIANVPTHFNVGSWYRIWIEANIDHFKFYMSIEMKYDEPILPIE